MDELDIRLKFTPQTIPRYIFIAVVGLFLAYKTYGAYRDFSALGIDLVGRYKEVADSPSFFGIMMLVLLVWSILGLFAGFFREEYFLVYPVLALEGIAYFVLEHVFIGNSTLGETVYEVLYSAFLLAEIHFSDCIDILLNHYGGIFASVGAGTLIGIIMLIVSVGMGAFLVGVAVLIVAALGMACISNIGFSYVTFIVLKFVLGIVLFFSDEVLYFLIFSVITVVGFCCLLIFLIHMANKYSKPMESNQTKRVFKIKNVKAARIYIKRWISDVMLKVRAYFKFEKSELLVVGVGLALLVLLYVIGKFTSWMDLWWFVLSVEDGESMLYDIISGEANNSMSFVIASVVSTILSVVAYCINKKEAKEETFASKIVKILCSYLIYIVFSAFVTKVITNWVYTPFSLETEFKIWITNTVMGGQLHFPNSLLDFLAMIALLIHYAIYLIGILILLAVLIGFGLQSAVTIATYAVILEIFYLNNINILEWNPFLLSFIYVVLVQFVNDYVIFSPPIKKAVAKFVKEP